MAKWVDPPSGWKYDFPKVCPDGEEPTNEWLVKNGYPQEEIDRMKDYFMVRYWSADEDKK